MIVRVVGGDVVERVDGGSFSARKRTYSSQRWDETVVNIATMLDG